MPPEVDPEHPPKGSKIKNSNVAIGFHKVKSSRAKPEVERTETTLKVATLKALSKSYSF